MPTSYPTKQAAVDAVFGAGTKILGEQANIGDAPNDKFDPSKPVDSVVNPRTVKKPNGSVLSVQRADGTPDTMVISDAKPVGGDTTGGGKGGVGYEVLEGGKTTPKATGSPISEWDRLDSSGKVIPPGDTTTPAVAMRDPKAPAGSQPYTITGGTELGAPSTWTPIREDPKDDTSRVIGLYDPKSQKVAASVSAAPGAKPSDPSKWTPIYRTPGDSSSGVVGQWDPTNNELHAVSAAPDGTQIVATTTAIYSIDKDTGKSTKVQDLDPAAVNKQAVTLGSKVYTFDPKDGSFTLPPNVQAAATVGNSTTLKDLVWYDDQGKEVGRTPNPNYGKAPVTAPTPNTVAPMIQVPDPKDPSQLVWIENKGQVVASEALKQLASHLSGQVIDGKISVDEAKALIDASNAKMTNDINKQNADTNKATQIGTAAGDVLRNAASNAQTGAGLLQNRVTTATGALNSLVSSAAGSKMTSIPGGVGEGLVNGLQDWVTGLGGGKDVYDTAARMVQAADPKISSDPTLANQAQQTLGNMLALYQQQNGGQPHPAVAATQAANASAQGGGVTAPVTIPGNAQGQQTNVGVNQALQQQQQADAALARQRAAALVRPPVPVQGSGFVAPISAVPGANYGAATAYTGGVAPWLAQPQPSFVAPMIPT